MNSGRHYDVAIIGAGLSGLAAGIRAAHFGKKVCIFERHNAPGGLNGFYSQSGRKFDAGLHAVTNFVPPGVKGTALGRLLRQLRLDREELALREQCGSRIAFGPRGETSLAFTNRFAVLESEVARLFPREIDGFRRLAQQVRDTPFDPDGAPVSARAVFARHLGDPLLREMLLCPLFYYGSATPRDLPFSQAAVLFQAIYLEGFARPAAGVRQIIRVLLDKYRQSGGERRMKCGVRQIVVRAGKAVALVLDDGTEITADAIVSSAGTVETAALLAPEPPPPPLAGPAGELAFVETISVLDAPPADLGWKDTIVFFNDSPHCHFEAPAELVDLRSGVICLPNNFEFPPEERLPEGLFRVTGLANYARWTALPEEAYRAEKSRWFGAIQESARRFLPAIPDGRLERATRATDMFTPRTVERFTGHRNGAIYGAPDKRLRGESGIANLYLCGTDQGLLGIVGAMLSGVTMANRHLLTNDGLRLA